MILKAQLGLKNTFFTISDKLGLGDKSDWKRMYSDLQYLGILPDNSNSDVLIGIVNPAIGRTPSFKNKIIYSKRVEDMANRAVGGRRGIMKLQEAFATNDARHANSGTSRVKNSLVANVYLNLYKYPLVAQNTIEKEKLKLAKKGIIDGNTKESELIRLLKPKLKEISDRFGFYKKGGNIYIKPSKRGSFTEWCGGKVTDECIARGKRSSSAAIRKKATFAANSRKWKHLNGGNILRNLNNWISTDNGQAIIGAGMGIYDAIKKLRELSKLLQEKLDLLKKYLLTKSKLNYLNLLNQQTDSSQIVNMFNANQLNNSNDTLLSSSNIKKDNTLLNDSISNFGNAISNTI